MEVKTAQRRFISYTTILIRIIKAIHNNSLPNEDYQSPLTLVRFIFFISPLKTI